MDSKKVIEMLIKIAEKQQLAIEKLAQNKGMAPEMSHDPMSGDLPSYSGPRVDLTPKTDAAPVKRDPYLEQLLAPIKHKLTEADWQALEKQRGMKPGEATDTSNPGWVPQVMAPKAPATPTSPSGPATQGGPPGQSKPLTDTEKKYLEMLKNKNK